MKTKNFFYALSVAICLLGVSTNAWGVSHYYTQLTATAAPEGYGKVYVTQSTEDSDEDENVFYVPADDDFSSHAEEEDEKYEPGSGKWGYMTAYATAERGYKFSTWSDLSGNGSPQLLDCSLTDNPIQVKMKAPTSDGTHEATITANFVVNTVPTWNVQYVDSTKGKGTYTVKYELAGATQPTIGGDPVETYDNDPVTFSATATSGYVFYRYVGWDDENNKYTIGTIAAASQTATIPLGTVKVSAEFTADPLIAGENTYSDLKDAVQGLRLEDGSYKGTIIVAQDFTVKAGYYTIPKNVTLIVPRNAGHAKREPEIDRKGNGQGGQATMPSLFRSLKLADGVTIDVFGAIEVGGSQNINGQGITTYRGVGNPCNTYGQLIMCPNSKIIVENKAKLRAWGYVTGDIANKDSRDSVPCGEIDVRRGGIVKEQFQILDWKGGTASCYDPETGMMDNPYKVFQVNQYFIQNIEVPTTYHPGSKLLCSTGMVMGGSNFKCNDLGVVGAEYSEDLKDDAMFLMSNTDDSKDTWVRKYYDPVHDKQVYEINNSARLGNLLITMNDYSLQSKNYIMPITNNMHIHLLSGNMEITQNTELLPGAEIEVDKKAIVTINEEQALYLYDNLDWEQTYAYPSSWAHQITYSPVFDANPAFSAATKLCAPNKRNMTLSYASSKYTNTVTGGTAGLEDAKLNIHGTFDVKGYIYTTKNGANIYSNNADAGTILFSNVAPTDSTDVWQIQKIGDSKGGKMAYTTQRSSSAILRNEDGTYPTTTTVGTPAGQSFCYLNDKWTQFTIDPDSSCFVYDQYDTYYAKPGAYVAINATKDPSTKKITGNPDHTFSDAAGTGRLFILLEGCQWWEVENQDNLYHCIHPQNDTYYYWDENESKWKEKLYTITWNNWDGSPVLDKDEEDVVYYLPYGEMPKFNSINPTRPADKDFTYNFIGWTPEFSRVTSDQTYTAKYERDTIKYTIIFKFVDSYRSGAEIERQQLPRDSMPVIPTIKRTGWYLKWTPSVGPVTGNATYEAEWMEELPDYYTITWKNYDNTVLTTTTPARDASVETVLSDAPTATRDANNEYTYVFRAWKPEVTAATQDQTYVAQFTPSARTYTILYFKEDGTTPNDTKASESLAYGATPTPPAVTKENPVDGHTYTLVWKTLDGNNTIQTVTGNASYKPTYLDVVNRYTVTATSSIAAGCVISGAGTFDYGTNVTLKVIPNEGYTFVKWSDEVTDNPRNITVKGNATYTAVVNGAPAMKVGSNETKEITEETQVSALYVCATPTTSSDLVGTANLQNSEGEGGETNVNNIPAYFDLSRGGKVFKHHTWYAFSVPFKVDAEKILFDGEKLQYNKESKKDAYDILYYDGSIRAAQGKTASCWKYVENDEGEKKYLNPGVFYMIAITKRDVTTIRFPKEAGAALLTTSVDISTYASVTGNDADANWNGIANPALYHANMDAIGSTEYYAYTYNPDFADPTNAYQRITLNTQNIKLGTPFFVQAPAAKSVVVVPVSASPASAPRRAKAAEEQSIRYQVMIARDGENASDDVVIRMDENKEEDVYVLGKDLVRFGLSSINPQMWIDRYNEKLCVNVQAPVNDEASYPLGFFAPADGEYTISSQYSTASDKYSLYLTYDGEAIWNLGGDSYTVTLSQGTTTGYGLRIVAKKAPEVATGVDEAIVDAKGETKKVLVNDQVFIIRNGAMYSIDGQLVK